MTNHPNRSKKVEHTSTPFHADESKSFYIFAHGSLAEQAGVSNGPFIANCSTQANRDFIVRACNSHDDLIKALEKIVKYADSEPDGNDFVEMHRANIESARAALAKAKG